MEDLWWVIPTPFEAVSEISKIKTNEEKNSITFGKHIYEKLISSIQWRHLLWMMLTDDHSCMASSTIKCHLYCSTSNLSWLNTWAWVLLSLLLLEDDIIDPTTQFEQHQHICWSVHLNIKNTADASTIIELCFFSSFFYSSQINNQ